MNAKLMKKTVLITGGTGLVGKSLSNLLVSKGYQVRILSRKSKKATHDIQYFHWDVEKEIIDESCINNVDFIVHLAGENVAQSRWTASRKRQILESRTRSTKILHQLLSQKEHQVQAFISSSATGYYGTTNSDKIFKENDPVGGDFLASVCGEWEETVNEIKKLKIRTVKLRTGVVLAKEKSALQKMLPPFRLGLGAALGSGKQYFPWIHIEDLCSLYLKAIEQNSLEGTFNAVLGDAVTNDMLGSALSKKLRRPYFMPNIPSFLFRLFFGEMAVILLNGSQVSADKIKKEGFNFKYDTIEKALDDLL
jgi:uncharacterized protein (TIGR01777 family)